MVWVPAEGGGKTVADRVLGLLTADAVNAGYLERIAAGERGLDRGAQLTFPGRAPMRAPVVMIVHRSNIEYLARVTGTARGDDLRTRFDLEQVTALAAPLPLRQIRARLRSSQHGQIDGQHGDLSRPATRTAEEVLIAHEGGLGSLLDEMFAAGARPVPAGRADVLAQERDTLATAVAFTGYPDLAPDGGFVVQDGLAAPISLFPEQSAATAAREDPMIDHDAAGFLGWEPQQSDQLAVRKFTDGARTLLVANVNRWPIETLLGPDLIYYHRQRNSYVTVQYKRMSHASGRWQYRPDEHFRKQLRDMAALDQACEDADDDGRWRWITTPSFIKVCRLDNLNIDSTSAVSGMCMPREHAQWRIERAGRLGESFAFDWDHVDDYLTATQFAQMVAIGAVGTSGAGTDVVRTWMDAALESKGSAILTLFDDPSRGRPPMRTRRLTRPALESQDL